jgi:hypothetical protein
MNTNNRDSREGQLSEAAARMAIVDRRDAHGEFVGLSVMSSDADELGACHSRWCYPQSCEYRLC